MVRGKGERERERDYIKMLVLSQCYCKLSGVVVLTCTTLAPRGGIQREKTLKPFQSLDFDTLFFAAIGSSILFPKL